MQALFLLAFAIGLGELARGAAARAPGRCAARPAGGARRRLGLRLQLPRPPLARRRRRRLGAGRAGAGGPRRALRTGAAMARRALRPPLVALGVFASPIAPELGRIVDFASFETFDPAGRRPRQPLQPALAAGGARRSGPRATSGSTPATAPPPRSSTGSAAALGAGGARLRALVVAAPRRARGARARSPSAALLVALRPSRRHALPGGEGDRARRAAGDADQRPGARGGRAERRGRWRRILRRRGIAVLFPRSARQRARRAGPGRARRSPSRRRRRLAACWRSSTARWGRRSYSPALPSCAPAGARPWCSRRRRCLAAARPRLPRLGAARGARSASRPTPGRPAEPPPPGIRQVLVYGDAAEAPFEGTDAGRPSATSPSGASRTPRPATRAARSSPTALAPTPGARLTLVELRRRGELLAAERPAVCVANAFRGVDVEVRDGPVRVLPAPRASRRERPDLRPAARPADEPRLARSSGPCGLLRGRRLGGGPVLEHRQRLVVAELGDQVADRPRPCASGSSPTARPDLSGP